MATGFYLTTTTDHTDQQQRTLIPQCGACKLYKHCKSPKMSVDGKGKKGILIIGEAPGETEDEIGQPFVGKSGSYLRKALSKIGISLHEDCWITNALICHPENNRTPTDKEVGYCRPNVLSAIRQYKPKVIIPLGLTAVASVLGQQWSSIGAMTRWLKWHIPITEWRAWVCPNYHPSFMLRCNDSVMDDWFVKYLLAAKDCLSKDFPVYDKIQIEKLLLSNQIKDAIRDFMDSDCVAFDYETNMLKPDSAESEIYCCSISDGERTVVFPYSKLIRKDLRRLLTSRVGKIASNIKFEHRWTKAILGVEVRNWRICTMNGAHVLDNRTGITSIKFQAFVNLGQKSYNEHIQPYLEGKGGYGKNKIKLCPLMDMLRYCGMDSLLEYRIAQQQLPFLQE